MHLSPLTFAAGGGRGASYYSTDARAQLVSYLAALPRWYGRTVAIDGTRLDRRREERKRRERKGAAAAAAASADLTAKCQAIECMNS
jgi:hypothetical protein